MKRKRAAEDKTTSCKAFKLGPMLMDLADVLVKLVLSFLDLSEHPNLRVCRRSRM